MRQVGVLCAAALYALDHHRERLVEDHENAKRLAEGLACIRGLGCDPSAVQTNIVVFEVQSGQAREFSARAAQHGVRINAISATKLRAVTHLDVTRADIDTAVQTLAAC